MASRNRRRLVRVYSGLDASRERQIRSMMQRARPILDSKDPDVLLAVQRVCKLVADEPDPEFTCLNLVGSALSMSEVSKRPWHECMDEIVDTYERVADGEADATGIETEVVVEARSIFSVLLDALIPTRFRRRHARVATDTQSE